MSEIDESTVERLLREFSPGTRVQSASNIFYAHRGFEVATGVKGTVLEPQDANPIAGLSYVQWDGVPGAYHTANDLIDPVEPVIERRMATAQCACGWRRPVIALTTRDGAPLPDNVIPTYECPCCGSFHAAADLPVEQAAAIRHALEQELARAAGGRS